MKDGMKMLLTRRSIGKVRPDPVPRTTIEELLRAAIRAPNHHLTEPWRFIVLTGDARGRIGAAHRAAVERLRPGADPIALDREGARLERAPVVIVSVVRTDPAETITAREDRDAVAAATQNLLLAAHAAGLGAMWRTGGMVEEPEIREALELRQTDAIVGFVYLGWPDVVPPARSRLPLDAVVEWHDI